MISARGVTLCAACLLAAPLARAERLTPANDPAIRYEGRVNFSDSTAPRLTWPGSRVTISFTGALEAVIIRDAEGLNVFNVYVDEREDPVAELTCRRGEHRYALSLDAPGAAPRVLTLVKRTEGAEGGARLIGFLFGEGGGLASPPPARPRRIEFYGDSITSGMAVLASDDEDDKGNLIKDHTRTYAALTARRLDAEHRAISFSGIGLVKSWFDFTMPNLFDRMDGTGTSGPAWDFSTWIPDVVVVNVGQNDFWLLGKLQPTIDPNQWIAAYVAFIKRLRAHYPDALIVCALGPMEANREGSPWPEFIRSAVARIRAEDGAARVETIFFPHSGYTKHPRVRHHEAMAEQLVEFLCARMGW